jgi:hypothetical protein
MERKGVKMEVLGLGLGLGHSLGLGLGISQGKPRQGNARQYNAS